MEEFHQTDQPIIISGLSDEAKVVFYKKTYTHLALAVLLFILVEMIFFQIPPILDFALSLTQG